MKLEAIDLFKLILDIRPDLRKKFGNDLSVDGVYRKFYDWIVTSGFKEYKALFEEPRVLSWLSEPPLVAGLTRLQEVVWQARKDVKKAFKFPKDVDDYKNWFFVHGIGELNLWPLLSLADKRKACLTDGPWREILISHLEADIFCTEDSYLPKKQGGVNLIGYVFGQLGIGEDVRMAARSFAAVGIPFDLVNFEPGNCIPQNDKSFANRVVPVGRYAINIFCLTVEEHGRFYAERGPAQLLHRHNIGYWPWELSKWPRPWEQLVNLVDEVWSSSNHTYASVKPVCDQHTPPVPVSVMPMAVEVDVEPLEEEALQKKRIRTRKTYGLPGDAFLFCFSFDLNSSIRRKNPYAILEAFKKAFPFNQKSSPNVGLVIKVYKPQRRNLYWEQLKSLKKKDPRVFIIEETLNRIDLLELYRSCDCFVSLHRAEGFGRGIAESLLLGLHVIATDYGGNTDFYSDEHLAKNIYKVGYELISINDGEYPHFPHQFWANPIVESAVKYMQTVLGKTEDYRNDISLEKRRNCFSLEVVGKRYVSQLKEKLQLMS